MVSEEGARRGARRGAIEGRFTYFGVNLFVRIVMLISCKPCSASSCLLPLQESDEG